MESNLIPIDGGAETATETTETARTLTITVKVTDASDVATVVEQVKTIGEVTGVSYYEQTYTKNESDKGYIY